MSTGENEGGGGRVSTDMRAFVCQGGDSQLCILIS